MKLPFVLWAGVGAAVLSVGGFAAWIASLPAAAEDSAPPAIDAEEILAALAALRPRKRKRPLIAIVGINNATETNDYLMPAGILRRAEIADVMMLATNPGPVTLFPALKVEPDATISSFDVQHPEGADYVIVPAMSRDDDPQLMAWLKRQAASGAFIVGVCAGAKVVAAAGLLERRKVTTHWYYIKELFEKYPGPRYVRDRRFVVDGRVATTTGITASLPMMLTLIEAIADRAKAEAVAADLGVQHWGAQHSSNEFRFTRRFAMTVLANSVAFWKRDRFGIELRPGVDEVSLALLADAWSRTYRSRALTFAPTPNAVETRNGIRILPDRVSQDWPVAKRLPVLAGSRASGTLNRTLDAIADRYGTGTAEVVAMQLEYPRLSAGRGKQATNQSYREPASLN